MKERFAAISLAEPIPVYRQITEQVRRMILSGRLAPGEKLPSTQQFVALWGKQAPTIQAGLEPLVREGLLVRCPGKGTFVRRREKKLTCVGVYLDHHRFSDGGDYTRSVNNALKTELEDRGIEVDVWVDPRPEKQQQSGSWAPFMQAAARREFQAAIVLSTNLLHLRWQTKLPVPTAFLTPCGVPNSVQGDTNQFVELALRALAKQGCRSVGAITLLVSSSQLPGGTEPGESFYRPFTDISRDLGLTIRNEWLPVARAADPRRFAHETYGYEEFLALWRRREHPDGLVVFDDVIARGVILALREKQVRVPEELKLVFSKNEAVELLCPMPATFLVQSERVMARALIDQIEKQFRGERCEPIIVPFKLKAHDGTSQPTTNPKG